MKYAQLIRVARVLACGLSATAALCIVVSTARADDYTPAPIIQSSVKKYTYVAAIRGGAYWNLNRGVQNDFGIPAPIGGVAITLEQEPLDYRTSFAVDYLYKTANGNKLSAVPVNFEYQKYQGPQGTVFPYFLLGVGAWFTHVNNNVTGVSGENTAFDTEIGLGVDTQQQIFAELRYNIVAPTLGENLSGPDLLVGVRF